MTRGSANRWLVVLMLGGLSSSAWAGKLDAVRQAVHGDDDRDDDRDDTCSAYDDDDDGGEVWDSGISPTIRRAVFYPHPYANGRQGHLLVLPPREASEPTIADGEEEAPGMQGVALWSARIATEYAYDTGPVHRPSLTASIDTAVRLGFTTNWTTYLEPLEGGSLDRLTIGDVNLTYRLVQTEFVEVRLGGGLRFLLDGQSDADAASGLNFTFQVDAFPGAPFVISMVGDLGSLGEAFYAHGRATIGVQLGPLEPYLGYDVVLIKGEAASVSFQGPALGVRAWF